LNDSEEPKHTSQKLTLLNITTGSEYKSAIAQDKINELLPEEVNFFFDGERLKEMEAKKEPRQFRGPF